MEESKYIRDHIVNYFLQGDKRIADPVLIEWLAESESNRKLLDQYAKIWEASKYYMKKEAFDTNVAWEKINEIHKKKRELRSRLKNACYTLSGVAASLLIIVVLSFMGVFKNESEVLVCMSAGYGNRSEIILPDGSVVKLNSGSDITYSYNHKQKIREVSFQGEGFFDVSKCKDPFIVKLENNLEVKVLGTSFNLRAYKDDRIVETSLVEGHIELNSSEQTLQVSAGEMVVFDKESNEIKQSEGILAHAYGWLENKLYMDNMSLNEVCKHLERWYNVDITIQKELGENIHYNGVLKEESITDVMNALVRLSSINYHIKGKNISITPK